MVFILTLGCLFLIYIYNLCQLVGPSLKFEWNRLVSPRFEWTLKFERSPRIEGITLRSPRIECFTYFWGWSSTWLTHGGGDRIAATLRTTFWNEFSGKWSYDFNLNYTEGWSSSDEVFTWTNDGLYIWCMCASLGPNELIDIVAQCKPWASWTSTTTGSM